MEQFTELDEQMFELEEFWTSTSLQGVIIVFFLFHKPEKEESNAKFRNDVTQQQQRNA
jgi:hypothetical protein